MIPSTGIGSSPIRPVMVDSKWLGEPRDGSVKPTAGFPVIRAKNRGKNSHPGTPVHDEYVDRNFIASALNQV